MKSIKFFSSLVFSFLLSLLSIQSMAQMDSTAIQPLFERLEGIEKYAVKKDVPILRALLEYKHDYDLFYVEEFYKQYMEDPYPYYIITLDPDAGYLSYSASAGPDMMSDYSKKYWNLSNGSVLIATEKSRRGEMVLESVLSFEKYENGNYTPLDASQVVPSYQALVEYLVPGNTDPLDFQYVLPRSGQDILFCLADRCIRLKWNGETFTTDGKEEIKAEDPPLPYNFRIDQRRDTEHFLAFELGGVTLSEKDRQKVDRWEKGTILSNKDLDLLYGQFTANKMRSWYNLAMEVGKIEILDNQVLSENTRAVIYQFTNDSEDFVGSRIVIRILKNGSWKYEVSYLNGTLEGRIILKTSHFVDQQSIRIYPKSQIDELPINYIPEIGRNTIDLPIQVSLTSSSNCFYLMKNSDLTFECDPVESTRIFPLTAEGLQRVRDDGNYQYFIDEVGKLTETDASKKEEIINYFKSEEQSLSGNQATEGSTSEEVVKETDNQETTSDDDFPWGILIPAILLPLLFFFLIGRFIFRKFFGVAKKFVESKRDVSSFVESGKSDNLEENILKVLTTLEPIREDFYKKAKKVFPRAFRKVAGWIAFIGLAIWSIATLLSDTPADFEVLIFIAIVSLVLGLFLGGIYTLLRRGGLWLEFAEQFKSEVLPPIMKLVNPNLTYDSKGMNEDDFTASKIFIPSPFYTTSDLVTDQDKNIRTAEIMYERKESIHRREDLHDRQYVFYGLFAECDLPQSIGNTTIQIVPSVWYKINFDGGVGFVTSVLAAYPPDTLHADMKKLDKVDEITLGNEALQELNKFYILSNEPEQAKKAINASTQKVIRYLAEKFGARKLSFSITGNKLYVALDYGKNLFEPGAFLKDSLSNPEMAKRIGNDVRFVDQVIREVGLLAQSLG